jgi:hypothetical protein
MNANYVMRVLNDINEPLVVLNAAAKRLKT